jgi:hypothetical protein
MSAFSAHAGQVQSVTTQAAKSPSIKISALPFNITAPGTYVLTSNLTSPITSYGVGAINISPAIAGSVVVDLGGFTLTGPGPWQSGGITIGVTIGVIGGTPNTYPIRVRHGTIQNFGIAVQTQAASNITINSVVFNLPTTSDAIGIAGVMLNNTDSSIVNNCTFNLNGATNGVTYGITDYLSTGGNSYNNNTFVNLYSDLVVCAGNNNQPAVSRLVLANCQFGAPPAQ